MTLQEIMNGWEKIVVFAGDEVIITWNHSLTLQAWGYVDGGQYKELACRTLEGIPALLSACIMAELFYHGVGNCPGCRGCIPKFKEKV